ncbi:MAG: ribonuclease HII [Pseudomonadota bacterium]
MSIPSFELENKFDGKVCGLDEVGRGPLAGPVVTACVYIPENTYNLDFVSEIRDSKKLSKTKLETLFELIKEHFIYKITEMPHDKIDEMNVLQASMYGMRQSLLTLEVGIDHALVDGNRCPQDLPCPATPVIKGDGISISIAAASILAKVTRDRIMYELAEEYPHYGWESNVGYPSKAHKAAINKHGITPYHRKSFAPVRNYLEFGTTERQKSLSV